MKNKVYETPVIEIIKFNEEDIITTSSIGGTDEGFMTDTGFFD